MRTLFNDFLFSSFGLLSTVYFTIISSARSHSKPCAHVVCSLHSEMRYASGYILWMKYFSFFEMELGQYPYHVKIINFPSCTMSQTHDMCISHRGFHFCFFFNVFTIFRHFCYVSLSLSLAAFFCHFWLFLRLMNSISFNECSHLCVLKNALKKYGIKWMC